MKPLSYFLGILSCLPAIAAQFTVDFGDEKRIWQTSELLHHPQVQTVQIPEDVSYKRSMLYRAVPLAALLTSVKAEDHLQAVAQDGFVAELKASPLLNTKGSRAWVAVEDPSNPWPLLKKGKQSAGPFYLVWTDPKANNIGPEEWPYQMASIKRLSPVAKRFPALVPDSKLAAEDPINRGFEVFQKNCLACHRLNGAGDSELGPDLNIPYSPVEYFGDDTLKRYIRNPESLRRWPQGKMPGVPASTLSDAELELLIGYLNHMAERKQLKPFT